MTTWQWNVVLALARITLKLIEETVISGVDFDEDDLNILREAVIRSK